MIKKPGFVEGPTFLPYFRAAVIKCRGSGGPAEPPTHNPPPPLHWPLQSEPELGSRIIGAGRFLKFTTCQKSKA